MLHARAQYPDCLKMKIDFLTENFESFLGFIEAIIEISNFLTT